MEAIVVISGVATEDAESRIVSSVVTYVCFPQLI